MKPLYNCSRIDRDIELSGKLDDPLWQKAETAILTDPIDGKTKALNTAVRLLYNDRYLYIGFECEDPYVWGTLTDRDTEIFTEECVEAFICPSGKVRQYYEINVSPLNTVFDTFILNGREDGGKWLFTSFTDYTCEGLLTKVYVDGELGAPGKAKGWSAEYAIPFSSIIGSDNLIPKPGEEWRINLFRIDSPEPGKLDFFAWSTVGRNDFHQPFKFGTLRFSK